LFLIIKNKPPVFGGRQLYLRYKKIYLVPPLALFDLYGMFSTIHNGHRKYRRMDKFPKSFFIVMFDALNTGYVPAAPGWLTFRAKRAICRQMLRPLPVKQKTN
jgi:hypothetical protein